VREGVSEFVCEHTVHRAAYADKKLNDEVKSYCVLEVVKNIKTLSTDFAPWSKYVLAFKIDESKEFCKYFGISENHFIEHLRQL
jgi:hypothetical protein